MIKRFRISSACHTLFFCFLLIVVSACTGLPGSSSGGNNTPTVTGNSTPTSGTPVLQTVQMPATQTSCPDPDTARAAVVRPLLLGKLQNLVYIYNEVPQNTSAAIGHVRRYDVSNGHKAEVVSSGLSIDQAQISADGQWVLFLSIPDPRNDTQHSALLQMVRMDGEGLQTLYCFSKTTYSNVAHHNKLPISLQWSVDQKSILISENTQNTTSQVFLLNVASGAIRQLLLDQKDANYSYSVLTWLDNTHFYLIKQGVSAPTPPATVYLVDASTATVASPGLVSILVTPTRMSYYSLDSSFDSTLLYSSYCLLAASPFSTNIQVGAAMGGSRHAIFQEQPKDCIETLRAISSSTLLLLVEVVNGAGTSFTNEVWTFNLLSNSTQPLTTLTSPNSGQTGYSFNPTSQFTWSNISRDSGFYALQAIDPVANNQTIFVSVLKGGAPTPIAVTNPGSSSVSLAGWTTL
ncbi:MAG TPA: hypothetical protein VGD98_20520 [Ktedonobacteraceae bacterium]